ncbi:MAG TPA: hypothetical protein VFC12_09690 [Terriglobales bacterium]|nr:hypothetical protein [Terriglobales bacterium]
MLVVVAATLLIAGGRGMFHGRLPPDTLATTSAQAEDVAFSIASNAGCGEFDGDEAPHDVSANTWQFDCRIGDVSFQIFVYGSDQSRSADLARLQADGRPYVTKAYYAVTADRQGVDKFAAMSATPPPQSIVDPFR